MAGSSAYQRPVRACVRSLALVDSEIFDKRQKNNRCNYLSLVPLLLSKISIIAMYFEALYTQIRNIEIPRNASFDQNEICRADIHLQSFATARTGRVMKT